MAVIVYGIPNCGSVKKALDALNQQGVQYVFHDYKKQGVTPALLSGWLKTVSWEVLLNRKGTTWRNLPEDVKTSVTDAASAQAVMLANPSCIKRPVIVSDAGIQVGLS